MTARLQGKVVIVTGAAQGIGAVYAEALAAEGACVTVADVLDAGPVAARITAAGGRALALTADVTDAGQMADMAKATVEAFGAIHVLVNNAAVFGTLTLKPFTEISSAEWDRVMAVNVRGPFEASKAVVPQMRRQGYGKIINVASGTVYKGTPLFMHYVTSKGAVTTLTRCLARELGDDGIRVNCLAPGLTMSEAVRAKDQWQGSHLAGNIAGRAIKREETSEDLIGSLIFLASPDSDFMTGQTMVVDGGSVMR